MKELKDYLHLKDYSHLEVWKVIQKYPDYEASNLGEVRRNGRILSKHISTGGYYRVGLTVNKRTRTTKNSILVALAWHENPLNKKTVNHKDTNKLNDCEWNLEWNTQKENVDHAIKNNCRKSFKLSEETISKIVAKSKQPVIAKNTFTGQSVPFASISMCAAYLGVTQPAISHAIKRLTLIKEKYLILKSGLAIDKSSLK